MNILILPELFYQISSNLNDKEKVFLTSCSKITYNLKSLIILDSEYNLEINDRWRVKNIIIKEFTLESKIKELLENLIPEGCEKVVLTFGDPESITVHPKYVKFISNNTNIKLFHNAEIIEKIVSYGCSYLAMKIMLNNNDSIDNINKQFIKASRYGYLPVVKLLIDLGANIHINDDSAIIWASSNGHLSIVELLINSGANIHAQNNQAIICASCQGYLSIVKLLIESGADIHVQNDQAIINASYQGYLSMVKLLIESGANIHAQNNAAIISSARQGYTSVVKLLIESGADIHARNTALRIAIINKCSDVIKLLEDNLKTKIIRN